MSRKNIILTLWFIAPIATFAGLYAMIFVTLDKDRPMDDVPAVGAGAGDTGNANAIGQWLAGRDPDAVSLATKAKRERMMIAPTDWPGGVEIRIPASAIDVGDAQALLTQIHDEQGKYTSSGIELNAELGKYIKVIEADQLAKGDRFVLATSLPTFDGDATFTDDTGRALVILTLSPVVPPREVGVNDPLPVVVPIESVYVEGSP